MKFKPLELLLQRLTVKSGQDHILLKKRRLELGMTQQKVADKAKIQPRHYKRIENGERYIAGASGRIMLAICAVE